MSKYHMLRVPAEFITRVQPHADALGWSVPQFLFRCGTAVADMIEDPSKRHVPQFVEMLDTTKRIPTPFPGYSLDHEASSRVAESSGISGEVQHIADEIAKSPELRALFQEQIRIRKGAKAKRSA